MDVSPCFGLILAGKGRRTAPAGDAAINPNAMVASNDKSVSWRDELPFG
jgi:hypothetical protein